MVVLCFRLCVAVLMLLLVFCVRDYLVCSLCCFVAFSLVFAVLTTFVVVLSSWLSCFAVVCCLLCSVFMDFASFMFVFVVWNSGLTCLQFLLFCFVSVYCFWLFDSLVDICSFLVVVVGRFCVVVLLCLCAIAVLLLVFCCLFCVDLAFLNQQG